MASHPLDVRTYIIEIERTHVLFLAQLLYILSSDENHPLAEGAEKLLAVFSNQTDCIGKTPIQHQVYGTLNAPARKTMRKFEAPKVSYVPYEVN